MCVCVYVCMCMCVRVCRLYRSVLKPPNELHFLHPTPANCPWLRRFWASHRRRRSFVLSFSLSPPNCRRRSYGWGRYCVLSDAPRGQQVFLYSYSDSVATQPAGQAPSWHHEAAHYVSDHAIWLRSGDGSSYTTGQFGRASGFASGAVTRTPRSLVGRQSKTHWLATPSAHLTPRCPVWPQAILNISPGWLSHLRH